MFAFEDVIMYRIRGYNGWQKPGIIYLSFYLLYSNVRNYSNTLDIQTKINIGHGEKQRSEGKQVTQIWVNFEIRYLRICLTVQGGIINAQIIENIIG